MIQEPDSDEKRYLHFRYNCMLVGYEPTTGTLQAMSTGISPERCTELDAEALEKLAKKRERDRLEDEAFARVLAGMNASILTSRR